MGYNIDNYLNILQKALDTGVGTQERARYLGAMEAVLVEHGKLTPGVPFNKRKYPYTVKKYWFFGPTIRKERTETYYDFMTREFHVFIESLRESNEEDISGTPI